MSFQNNTTMPAPATSNQDDDVLTDFDYGETTAVAVPEPRKPEPKSETVSDSKPRNKVIKFKGGKKTTPDDDKQFAPVADRIRGRAQKGVLVMVENGRDLMMVKKKMGHGRFGHWLKREFGWTERTAQNYMNAAKAYDEFSNQGCAPEAIVLLPPTVFYSFDKQPQEVKDKFVEALKSGDVAAAVQKAKSAKKAKSSAAKSSKKDAVSSEAEIVDAEELVKLITAALPYDVRNKIANRAGFTAPHFGKLLQKEIADSFGVSSRAKAA